MIDRDAYRQFGVAREVTPDGITFYVFGDVDIFTAVDLEAEIAEAASLHGSVAIDLTACRYLDSSGMRLLVLSFRQFGSRLTIRVARESVIARALRVTGLLRALPVVTDLDASFQS